MATPKSRMSPQQSLQARLHKVADTLQQLVDAQLNDAPRKPIRKITPTKRQRTSSADNNEPSTSKLLHDLRVSCRRAEIALKVCPRELTKKQSAWFREQLQAVRQSCNVLRDDEVLRKWLRDLPDSEAKQDLLKSISKNIKAGQHAAAKRARTELQRRHFRQHIEELRPAGKSAPAKHADAPSAWRGPVGRALFQSMNKLIQAIPDNHDDYVALHQLRIAAKRLRYCSEFAGELDPQLQLAVLIKLLTDMQDKLGELHDAVVRVERLTEESNKLPEVSDLLAAARDALAESATTWKKWWHRGVLQKIVRQGSAAATKLLNTAAE